MAITRDINAFSPLKPEDIVVQTLFVQMGTGGASRPVTESFIYDPSPMTVGILLSFPLAPETTPAVFLRGIRMVVGEGGNSGVDVAVYEDTSPVSGDPAFGVAFIGGTYPLVPGDRVVVDYWTTAQQEG